MDRPASFGPPSLYLDRSRRRLRRSNRRNAVQPGERGPSRCIPPAPAGLACPNVRSAARLGPHPGGPAAFTSPHARHATRLRPQTHRQARLEAGPPTTPLPGLLRRFLVCYAASGLTTPVNRLLKEPQVHSRTSSSVVNAQPAHQTPHPVLWLRTSVTVLPQPATTTTPQTGKADLDRPSGAQRRSKWRLTVHTEESGPNSTVRRRAASQHAGLQRHARTENPETRRLHGSPA
ncbi:Hypothetical protein AAM4_1959 [Actinomyces succiniciruminis]|uniref:Uncharacterized protein n=1 Tax=Actinomyces succiniciruminis TaxID=1522002 RepID=A0A1L7RCZ5_9ACTO|nr:Hypothetical protein AAM4_1959 [Actinomyces succiniciruminis]